MNWKTFTQRYRDGDRSLGSRSSTLLMALSFLDKEHHNVFAETGTTRKNLLNTSSVEERAADGGATVLLGDFCKTYGGEVWTCDIDAGNIENCKIATREYADVTKYHVGDSVDFLDKFGKDIDFLYLDSVDSHEPGANEHQLKEIQAAMKWLDKSSVILLDDLGAKTQLSIPFLKANNWCQILIDIPYPSHYNNFQQGLFVHETTLYTNHSLIPVEQRYK